MLYPSEFLRAMLLDKIGFQNWLRIKNLSGRTIELYSYHLDKLSLMSEFNQEVVNEFLLRFNNQIARAFLKNYKDYLIKNKNSTIHTLEEINRIRDIEIPQQVGRQKQRIPKVVSKLEVYEMEKNMTSERNKLMLLITFFGGLRLSGLLNIKPYDFQWKKWSLDKSRPCELKVIEKGDKERVVFIPPEVAERLLRWIRDVASKNDSNPENPLFKVKCRRFETIIEKNSIKSIGRKITPHVLRHGCATYLLENGWNLKEIKEYLGHESIQTTEIYTHINKENLKDKFGEIN